MSAPEADLAADFAAPAARRPIPARTLIRLAMGLVIGFLCIVPFVLIFAISLGHKVEGAAWVWGFEFSNYERFFVGAMWPDQWSGLYLQKLGYSLYYAVIASVLAVSTAFPFTYFLTRLSRPAQARWLIFLLSTLSLSEVFVVMGWDILLSNKSGLPMVLRTLGITDLAKAQGWFGWFRDHGLANPRDFKFKTSVFATVLTMAYLVWPYAVILLYPPLSRLDSSMIEAARTMGARPGQVMRTVILPTVRLPLVGAVLLLFVLLLGIYVAVSVFADPAQQTLAISIYDEVRGATLNAPFGAAQSVILLVTAGAFLLMGQLILNRRGA